MLLVLLWYYVIMLLVFNCLIINY